MLRWQVATYYSIIILVHLGFRQKVGCKSLDRHIHNKYYKAIESRCVAWAYIAWLSIATSYLFSTFIIEKCSNLHKPQCIISCIFNFSSAMIKDSYVLFALVTCASRIFCHKAVNSKEISFKRTNSESTH